MLTAGAPALAAGAEPPAPRPPGLGLIALTRAAALGDAHPSSAGFLAMTYERGWGAISGRPFVFPAGPPAPQPSDSERPAGGPACGHWSATAGRLAVRVARLRAAAARIGAGDRSLRVRAVAGWLGRSRVGYLLLLEQLCSQPQRRVASLTLEDRMGPGTEPFTVAGGPQADAIGALLPATLPAPTPALGCVARGSSPLMRPTRRTLRVGLSDGADRLELAYSRCVLPAPLQAAYQALRDSADPCGCPHGG